MKGLILALGAPNDRSGHLSQIAQDRLNGVLKIFQYNPDLQITCTGGIGAHFNETDQPHYIYAHQYLQQHGVPAGTLTTPVYSTNTAEDFTNAREFIYQLSPPVLIIVTSDFHIARVRILHDRFVNYPSSIFWGVPSTVAPDKLEQLQQHEKNAIEKLNL